MTAPPDTGEVREDITVVERSLDDPELFALLYDRYFTEVYRYLAARLGREQAEGSADGPEDRVTSQLAARAIWPELVRGLKGLSKGDRDVVFLLVFGRPGYEEIAAALDIPGTFTKRAT